MKARAVRRTTGADGELQRLACRPAVWRTVLALLLMVTAATSMAAGPSIGLGPLQVCGATGAAACRPTEAGEIDLDDPVVHVRQQVDVPAAVAGSRLPLAVTLVGTMSSEVSWNGHVIASNGTVGPDADSEVPGLFHVVVPVPREAVRLGHNVLDIRMSAYHRWPVRIPVQQIRVGFYAGPATGELGAYWPALLTAGALLLALLYFGTAPLPGHARRDALILAGVAACATLQLAIETSRTFVDYAYPWHVARISAIMAVVAVTSALMALYAARRFSPGRMRLAGGTSVVSSVLAIVVIQSFDAKAWICLLATSLICLGCAANARRRRDGRVAIVLAVLFGAILVWTSQDALDRGYYLFVAAVLGLVVAEQVVGQRRLQAGLAAERKRGDTLEARLAVAEASGDPIVTFRDGARVHRVPERDIVRITAADDFCEVVMTGRRPLLVGGTLKSLENLLPDRFLRVHKSHLVNLAHVAGVGPRPGGGHQISHDDGSFTPVGRTYREGLDARLE